MSLRPWRSLPMVAVLVAGTLGVSGSARAGEPCGEIKCPGQVDDGMKSFRGTIMYAEPGGRAHRVGGSDGSDCDGCVWGAVPSCAGNVVYWDPVRERAVSIDTQCTESGCAVNGTLGVNLWFFVKRPGSTEFRQVDEFCVTPDTDIVTGQQVEDEVGRYVRELPVPEPAFDIQPARTRVVHKDVIFLIRSELHRTVSDHQFRAFGIAITLDAEPTYEWDFDTEHPNRRTLQTKSPGHRWPNHDVMTRYDRPGKYGVQVVARWTGTYTVSGIEGEFTVAGPAVSSDEVVPVSEARAVLYDD